MLIILKVNVYILFNIVYCETLIFKSNYNNYFYLIYGFLIILKT